MKTGIHPEYHLAKVTCSCGNSFEIGATVTEMRVELCAACHPFYTGTQKFIDTAGRLERFQDRLSKAKNSKKTPLRSRKGATEGQAEPAKSQPESNKERLKALKKKLIQA